MRVAAVLDGRFAPRFLDALHDACRSNPEAELALVHPAGDPGRARHGNAGLRRAVDGIPPAVVLARRSRRRGIAVLGPVPGGVNAPGFGAALRTHRIDVVLCAGSRDIWRSSALGAVGRAVNYHDSLLPAHAGMGATSFSLYEGDPESGFTFHDMVPEVDAGPILLQGAVPICERDHLDEVLERKWAATVPMFERLLDVLASATPGTPQAGARSVHRAADCRRLTTVPDPRAITADELERRVRCFRWVDVGVGARMEPVTGLSDRPAPGRLALRTADRTLYATRLATHPIVPYRMARRAAGVAGWAASPDRLGSGA